tara:strand:- start:2121 stop:3443 length:1323 start_codon:yes stop_codon:yes gene_type:complete
MANTYLTHTTSTPTNNDKCTISFWIKFSNVGSDLGVFSQHTDSNNRIQLARLTSGALSLFQKVSSSIEISITTNRLFRDVSAWYNVVIAFDTTQSTASDRVKFYVNGVQETSFSVSTYPSQNTDIRFNSSSLSQEIGRITADTYMNGYMSHVAFVDGQALAPTVFGQTDSTSGIWKFKNPTGITWGNNGFHLKFENSGALGTDSSGNSNTFTVNGNGKQALDTPTNIHATMNSLVPSSSVTFSNGNNTLTGSVSDNYSSNNIATLGASSGKWYWEAKYTTANANTNPTVGIAKMENYRADVNNTTTSGYAVVRLDGEIQVDGSNAGSSYWGSNPVAGDIIMFALDMDNGKFYLGKNGSWENSGVPTSGSTGTGSITSSLSGTQAPCIRYLASVFDTNFGNGFFGTTAISSAGSNGNGSLFEYDVPSGYYALNTKNINTYG